MWNFSTFGLAWKKGIVSRFRGICVKDVVRRPVCLYSAYLKHSWSHHLPTLFETYGRSLGQNFRSKCVWHPNPQQFLYRPTNKLPSTLAEATSAAASMQKQYTALQIHRSSKGNPNLARKGPMHLRKNTEIRV